MFSTKKIMFLYSENSIKYCKYSKIAHVIVFDKSEIFQKYCRIMKIYKYVMKNIDVFI